MSSLYVIGMIHLGVTNIANPIVQEQVIKCALYDFYALQKGGVDAVCIVNESDAPRSEHISDASYALIYRVCEKIKTVATIDVGICLLYNDRRKSLNIAGELDLQFVRIDTFIDDVKSDTGVTLKAHGEEIVKYRNRNAPYTKLYTDIHTKYKTLRHYRPIEESAHAAIDAGSDAIIITGSRTGLPPSVEEVSYLKLKLPNHRILVGSGMNLENIRQYKPYIVGTFVGTSFYKNKRVCGSIVKKYCETLS